MPVHLLHALIDMNNKAKEGNFLHELMQMRSELSGAPDNLRAELSPRLDRVIKTVEKLSDRSENKEREETQEKQRQLSNRNVKTVQDQILKDDERRDADVKRLQQEQEEADELAEAINLLKEQKTLREAMQQAKAELAQSSARIAELNILLQHQEVVNPTAGVVTDQPNEVAAQQEVSQGHITPLHIQPVLQPQAQARNFIEEQRRELEYYAQIQQRYNASQTAYFATIQQFLNLKLIQSPRGRKMVIEACAQFGLFAPSHLLRMNSDNIKNVTADQLKKASDLLQESNEPINTPGKF